MSLRPASRQYFMLDVKGSNTWKMRPRASAHMSQHTCQSLHPTQKTSLLFELPGLEITALRGRSRRGVKNSIQTCRSSLEAYEQSFRWIPSPSTFREARLATQSSD